MDKTKQKSNNNSKIDSFIGEKQKRETRPKMWSENKKKARKKDGCWERQKQKQRRKSGNSTQKKERNGVHIGIQRNCDHYSNV